MPRPMLYAEKIIAQFPEGTLRAIAKCLLEGEDRATFLRLAVAKELTRRKRKKPS
jgi:hypothetical protein